MSVHLPVHKYIAWNGDLEKIMKSGESTLEQQKKINGRMTHAAYIFKPGCYFLNRFRELQKRCEEHEKQKISNNEKFDFILWSQFLVHLATEGVNINNITYTKHDMGAWSDCLMHFYSLN